MEPIPAWNFLPLHLINEPFSFSLSCTHSIPCRDDQLRHFGIAVRSNVIFCPSAMSQRCRVVRGKSSTGELPEDLSTHANSSQMNSRQPADYKRLSREKEAPTYFMKQNGDLAWRGKREEEEEEEEREETARNKGIKKSMEAHDMTQTQDAQQEDFEAKQASDLEDIEILTPASSVNTATAPPSSSTFFVHDPFGGFKPARFGSVPTVTLYLGRNKIPFEVHMNLLHDASPVLKATLSNITIENSKRVIDLPDDDPEFFEHIVSWLYYKTYDNPQFTGTGDDEFGWNHLVNSYAIAAKYAVTSLMNNIMDKLCDARAMDGQGQPPVDTVYRSTNHKSKLREFVVAFHVWEVGYLLCDVKGTSGLLVQRPEFTKDLAISMALRIKYPEKNPFDIGSSYFYEDETKKGGSI